MGHSRLAGGEQDAGDRGEHSRSHHGADNVTATAHARELCGLRVGADGVEVAPSREKLENDPEQQADHQGDNEGAGDWTEAPRGQRIECGCPHAGVVGYLAAAGGPVGDRVDNLGGRESRDEGIHLGKFDE